MKVFAEASEACCENYDTALPVSNQVLIYETPPSDHPDDQQWVQLTYETLRDENGEILANFDGNVWLIQRGQHAGHIASDLIVTP